MAKVLHCIVNSAAALWVWWTLIPGNVVLIGGRTKFHKFRVSKVNIFNIPTEHPKKHTHTEVSLFLTIRHRLLGIRAHGTAIRLPLIAQHLLWPFGAHKVIIRNRTCPPLMVIIKRQRPRQQVVRQIQNRQVQSCTPRRYWARQLIIRQIQHRQRPQVVQSRDLASKFVPVQQQCFEPNKAAQITRDQPLHRVVGHVQFG